MNYPKWKPVTETEQKPDGIDFVLTPQERDTAVNAKLDITAMQREANRFVPGLVAKRVDESELSEAERVAFGFAS